MRVARSTLQAGAGACTWLERPPLEEGRTVLMRWTGDGDPVRASPPGVGIGSRVHEYGGGAVCVQGATAYYVDHADQQVYRVGLRAGSEGATPYRLTGAGVGSPASGGRVNDHPVRYGDLSADPAGRWLVAVEERWDGATCRHRIVAIDARPAAQRLRPPAVLVDHGDFVSAPRVSADGRSLAWITWDRPAMPWDSSTLRVARLDLTDAVPRLHADHEVAGGGGSSVGQPLWCRDGALVFAWDRDGWWQLYRVADPGRPSVAVRLVGEQAECHEPDWVLGIRTVVEVADGSILCRVGRPEGDALVRLQPPWVPDGTHVVQEAGNDAGLPGAAAGAEADQWRMEPIALPAVAITGIAVPRDDEQVAFVAGASPAESSVVWRVDLGGGRCSGGGTGGVEAITRRTTASLRVCPGEAVTLATRTGPVPGWVYLPVPSGERRPPPLVAMCHGGPTGAWQRGLDPVVQLLVDRGIAVGGVDYRGSSGYGREYRQRILGRWGADDVDDVIGFAEALAATGLVDGTRMVARGSSAGGMTALGCLVRSDRFAGAVAWYGVTDLEALAATTHPFEANYLDGLVGPLPAARDTYRERSPRWNADRISGSVLLFQGKADPVVPAEQTVQFAEALVRRGVRCECRLFDGESHGFRRPETLIACLTDELVFLSSLFGGSGPDQPGGEPGARSNGARLG